MEQLILCSYSTPQLGIRYSSLLAIATIIVCSCVLGCSSTQELSSSWSNEAITVDGNASEWGSGLTNLKDTKVYIGVRNDDDFVYVCLTSTDQSFRRQLVGAGLNIWFENADGVKMGVHYPIGMAGQALQPLSNPDGEEEPEGRERMSQQFLQDLEVLGPGEKDRNLFSVVQVRGIGVKVGGLQNTTAYELKVPLKTSAEYPYALGASPGSTLKVSIATGKFEGVRSSNSGEGMRGGGGRRGGGRGVGGGMPGGGMRDGSGRPQGQRIRPEPLDITINLQLATHRKLGGE